MHDSLLPFPAVEIDPKLVVSGLLLDSDPGLHRLQDQLLQQSPGWSRQILRCSCSPAEKEVRPNFRRYPRQAPLASSWAKDPIQAWGVGLPMSPWEHSILPIRDAHCSGGCLWSSIASISCPWGLELLDVAQGCSPSLVQLSGTHFLPDCATSAWLSLSLGDSWKPSCLEMHMALTR